MPDLVDAALDLLIDGELGIWHLASQGAVSWAGFAKQIAVASDLDAELVRARPWTSLGWPAPRPAHAPLASERGALMPSLEEAIGRFASEWRSGRRRASRASTEEPAELQTS